jgi:hypothetical protein
MKQTNKFHYKLNGYKSLGGFFKYFKIMIHGIRLSCLFCFL